MARVLSIDDRLALLEICKCDTVGHALIEKDLTFVGMYSNKKCIAIIIYTLEQDHVKVWMGDIDTLHINLLHFIKKHTNTELIYAVDTEMINNDALLNIGFANPFYVNHQYYWLWTL